MIQEKARVTILRIADVFVAFDAKAVHVLFTLYEKSNKYGPVDPPKHDELLKSKLTMPKL
jgi:hypothetical protein